MATQDLLRGGDAGRWEQAIYAFLAGKDLYIDRASVLRPN